MKTINEPLGERTKSDRLKDIKDALTKESEDAKVKDLKRPGRQPRLTGVNNGQ